MFCNDLKLCHIWPETKRKMVHLTSWIDSLPDRNMFMIRLPQALKGILIVTVFQTFLPAIIIQLYHKPRLLCLMHYSLFPFFIVNHPVFSPQPVCEVRSQKNDHIILRTDCAKQDSIPGISKPQNDKWHLLFPLLHSKKPGKPAHRPGLPLSYRSQK